MTEIDYARLYQNIREFLRLEAAAGVALGGAAMSLFIGTLAWDTADYAASIRLGVLSGSLLSGILGYVLVLVGCRALPARSGDG